MVTTTQLAEKVILLYWPHTAPFRSAAAGVLRQNAGGQAEILSAIRRFRDSALPDPNGPLAKAKARASNGFRRLVRHVEWKLVEMPLPRVQQLGDVQDRFIYEIAWSSTIRQADFADDSGFDNRIHLVAAAGDHLVRLSGLLRPFIQRKWASMVARLNRESVDDSHLDAFLFGDDRIDLEPVRAPLRQLQSNRCFYCEARMAGPTQVDHFMPWSRHPDDGIENLVVAHPRCNGDKRDYLASAEHVERWAERAGRRSSDLAAIATARQWSRNPEGTLSVARAIYLRLRPEVRLWQTRQQFVAADRPRLLATLGSCQP